MNALAQKNAVTSLARAFISKSGPISPSVLKLGGGDSKDLTINELETAVVADTEFSLRVLALANSAFYSRQHEISSLREALIVLGVDTVRKLAVSMLSKSLHSSSTTNDESLMLHGQAVAIAAETLCKAHLQGDPRRAFAAGLLHDIGILAIQVLEQDYNTLRADHATLGGEIADLLGLSASLSSVIAHHNQPENAGGDDTSLETTIFIANEVAARCGFANDRESYGDENQLQSAAASLGLLESDIDDLATNLPTLMQNHQATIDGIET